MMRVRTLASALLCFFAVLAVPGGASEAALLAVTAGGELWVHTGTPVGWQARGRVPDGDGVVLRAGLERRQLFLLGADGSVHVSGDGGREWRRGGSPGAGRPVDLFPDDLGNVFLLTEDGVVWRADELAAEFVRVGSCGEAGQDLVVEVGGVLLVAGGSGDLLLGQEGAVTWERRAIPGGDAGMILIAYGRHLVAAYPGGTLLRSPSRGRDWEILEEPPLTGVSGLAASGDTLACLGSGELAIHRGNGWQALPGPEVGAVVLLGSDEPSLVMDARHFPELLLGPRGSTSVRRGEAVSVRFRLLAPDTVSLTILTSQGKVLAVRGGEGFRRAGIFTISWVLGNLPTGHHRLRVQSAGGETAEIPLLIH